MIYFLLLRSNHTPRDCFITCDKKGYKKVSVRDCLKIARMETKGHQPIRILLADDDDDDCELFQQALIEVELNAKLTTVEDGDRLMQHLAANEAQHPDLIFLDINLPRKTGKECLKEIRRSKQFQNVPVIMFTTSSHQEDIDETFANGANLYVSKPVFFRDEVEILKKIFLLTGQKDFFKPDKTKFFLNTASQ